MHHQKLTSAQILPHPSASPRQPRVYRLLIELTPDADLSVVMKTFRRAGRRGCRIIEAQPYRGQTGQIRRLTTAAVKRREHQRHLTADEDDDIFRRRSHNGFSF